MSKNTPSSLKSNLGALVEQPLSSVLQEKYLAYALSTITARSLPDVRDGMKPVHRRLLFAMQQLQLKSSGTPKKSARVVGDVIGKFHPHGDQSVYDALVRLAQDFSVRYPLVDGQGNFGNIDGDNAAAMRYTEARLTPVAELMLQGIDDEATDFRATYDGETLEPIVLPAAFPNLLANGSNGIAVGMATSIPPHNVDELASAMLALIDGDVTDAALAKLVPGPDFPTGGVLVESAASIAESYTKGKGSFRLRAKWEKEELKGGAYQIVVTEMPYQVQKARLVEKMADLLLAKKLPLLDDVRDESAEDVRLVLIPKSRNVDADLLMEQLFRNCDLEVRISLNMNVLDEGRIPMVMGLRQALQAYLNHRKDVLVRVSMHRLSEVERRLEVLGGYLVAYLNLDKVIKIIREEDEPKPVLMRVFKLTDVQAEAILNMRLRSLRKLEEMEIRGEQEKLTTEQKNLQALIASESRQWKSIRKEVEGLQKLFSKSTKLGARRTSFGKVPQLAALVEDSMVEREPVTVVCSQQGWMRALKGHEVDLSDLKYKDGDAERFVLKTTTADKILFAAANGKFYTVPVEKLPSGRGFGEALRLMIDLPAGMDVMDAQVYNPEAKFLLVSSDGRGFVVKGEDCVAQTKAGKQVMTLDEGVVLKTALPIDPSFDHVAVMGTNRKLLAFPIDQVPTMARGKGVTLQKYKEAKVQDVCPFNLAAGLTIADRRGKPQHHDLKLWVANRASQGKLPPTGWPI